MKLNASLEYLASLLPVEVVVVDESVDPPLKILKPVLMVIAVTSLP